MRLKRSAPWPEALESPLLCMLCITQATFSIFSNIGNHVIHVLSAGHSKTNQLRFGPGHGHGETMTLRPPNFRLRFRVLLQLFAPCGLNSWVLQKCASRKGVVKISQSKKTFKLIKMLQHVTTIYNSDHAAVTCIMQRKRGKGWKG